MKQVLIATKNEGKVPEIESVLRELVPDLTCVSLNSLSDIVSLPEVEENAQTYEGNAILKAMAWGVRSGMLTLAEDSGFEIKALKNWPGVHTARIHPGPQSEKNLFFLEEHAKTGSDDRTCRLRSVVALFEPATFHLRTCEGVAEGELLTAPEGDSGFGVDPIFYYKEARSSGGKLSLLQKNSVSHRGKALRKASVLLKEYFL